MVFHNYLHSLCGLEIYPSIVYLYYVNLSI
jgi:hypothetical protein